MPTAVPIWPADAPIVPIYPGGEVATGDLPGTSIPDAARFTTQADDGPRSLGDIPIRSGSLRARIATPL